MKGIVIVLVLIIVLGIGGFLFFQNSGSENPLTTSQSNQTTSNASEPRMIEGYQGEVLAGEATPYIVFHQADYEKAIADGKVILVNFYANWCPICRAEQSEIFEGFEDLNLSNVVGFQVNFKDDQTDDDEQVLADQFQIPYQHTKVILVDGQEVFKETVQWERKDVLETLSRYANQ